MWNTFWKTAKIIKYFYFSNTKKVQPNNNYIYLNMYNLFLQISEHFKSYNNRSKLTIFPFCKISHKIWNITKTIKNKFLLAKIVNIDTRYLRVTLQVIPCVILYPLFLKIFSHRTGTQDFLPPLGFVLQ